jgi:DnaJ-class molecular chaperone
VFKRKGDNFEVDVPITIVEAVTGGTVEVRRSAATQKIRVTAGTEGTAPVPAPSAGEGPARNSAGRGRRGDIHNRFRIPTSRESLTTEQKKQAVEELSKGEERQPACRTSWRGRAGRRDDDGEARPAISSADDQGVFMIFIGRRRGTPVMQSTDLCASYEAKGLISRN